jgi:hypothetical protein
MRSERVRIAHESRLGVIRAHPNNPDVHTAGKARPKLLQVSGACGASIALVKLGWNRRVRITSNQRCASFWTPPRHACLLTVRKGYPHHKVTDLDHLFLVKCLRWQRSHSPFPTRLRPRRKRCLWHAGAQALSSCGGTPVPPGTPIWLGVPRVTIARMSSRERSLTAHRYATVVLPP